MLYLIVKEDIEMSSDSHPVESFILSYNGASDGWDGASDGLGWSERWFRLNDGMEF